MEGLPSRSLQFQTTPLLKGNIKKIVILIHLEMLKTWPLPSKVTCRKKHTSRPGNFYTVMNQEERDTHRCSALLSQSEAHRGKEYFSMVKKKNNNTTNINMVGKEGAKSSLLKMELCENISIFPGKEHVQWQNCKVDIHWEGFYH